MNPMGNPHARIREALESALAALDEAVAELPPTAVTPSAGEWQVTLEGGETIRLAVEQVAGGWRVARDRVSFFLGKTPRHAALNWAVKVKGWPVVEVLAPGVISRAALEGAAQRAERNWNRLDAVLLRIVGDDEADRDAALQEMACSIGLAATANELGRLIRAARERERT